MNLKTLECVAAIATFIAFGVFACLARAARKPGVAKSGNGWPVWLRCLAAAVLINLASFILTSVCLGGDAMGGKSEGGRYCLGYRGQYREVSQAVFAYSRAHEISVFGSMVILLFVCGFPRFRRIE